MSTPVIISNLTITPGTFNPISILKNLSVEAIDITTATIANGAADQVVVVSPSVAHTTVHFVLVIAASYPLNAGVPYLSYKIDANTNGAVKVAMS